MTATAILTDLSARGVLIWAEADRLKFDAPSGTLTDVDRAALREHKAELLALLRRPALGSAVRPLTVRARRLTVCPFDGCGGDLATNGDSRYCRACDYWFRRIEPIAEDLADLTSAISPIEFLTEAGQWIN